MSQAQNLASTLNSAGGRAINAAIPVINFSAFDESVAARRAIADAIGRACREYGFFYVTGHGVSASLQARLQQLSCAFFAQPAENKLRIGMARGGRAWRGYFPVGDELTAGQPDLKEGLYFGAELDASHPLVRAGAPLHGVNLFPAEPAQLRVVVLDYMTALTQLGHRLMSAIALSLELPASYFAERYTSDPLTLFRIFNYPANNITNQWGVGEHTDYGLLTILLQDDAGGLQIKWQGHWISAPPLPNAFVCNLGDMLDRLTGGLYRSTPHRVSHESGRDRLSFPFFFDPNFTAIIEPLPLTQVIAQQPRWDNLSPHEFQGTYGEYLLRKISKVFPQLSNNIL